MADELMIEVLREIRDEVRGLGTRIDETNSRLDQSNERLAGVENTLGHVQVALVDLAEQQRFVVRWLKADRRRSRRFEDELNGLKRRVDVIEDRLEPED